MLKVDKLDQLPQPCVLLCRHRNMRGPVYTIMHWAGQARPWIYWPFFTKADFYQQMYGYTLTKRLGWPDGLAKAMARLLSCIIPPLISSFGGIPVYRNDARIRETFRRSIEQLEQGRDIMIYPDVDYTSNEDVGAVYDGFFMLERMYFRKTGRHLPFVPVHLDTHRRTLKFGEPVVFTDANFNEEKERVKNAILAQWHENSAPGETEENSPA